MRTRRILTIGVCLGLAAAACGGDNADSATTASPPTTAVATTTSMATTTTSVPVFTSEEALEVADAYFSSYNAGDAEAVLALFDPAATYEDNFGPVPAEDWEQLLVWNAAQGTELSEPTCIATPDDAGGIAVSCPHANLDVLVQAVSGPPVPIDLTLTITPTGISRWVSYFGNPDFQSVSNPFNRWMTENHPEDAKATEFGSWTTVGEAEQYGLLRAQYAADWSDWLAENDCDYRLGC